MKVRCSEANKCKDVACQHHCEHEKELRFGMCDWQGCAVVMKKVRCVRVQEVKE